ncbi:putative uncharacterized protein DDB_G0291608 [Ananas comosus]|uniref:Myb/SANT-like DNA-binding domain-containing protein n=1 Tax=Ananas comosus TaxID=4615 RepID=A0A6P5G2P1_ANACO|nr:putative uncharacterized protein DDB_G0291608 [Ananas comosus]
MDASAAAAEAEAPPPPSSPVQQQQLRGRRDEWSEGAVRRLLEAYESAWSLRGRAKLRGSDWAGIARHVSLGSRPTSPETTTTTTTTTTRAKSARQCKNKVESMKKRFRSESSTRPEPSTRPGSSSPRRRRGSSCTWRFYGAMERLLSGAKSETHSADFAPYTCRNEIGPSANNNNNNNNDEVLVGGERGDDANSSSSKGKLCESFPECRTCDDGNEEEGEEGTMPNTTGIDPSNKTKKRKGPRNEVAESIRALARSILKVEKARIEMCKNSEKMKAEAEVRRGETELKMTEIVAETQLRIAKLLAKRLNARCGKSGSSTNDKGSG